MGITTRSFGPNAKGSRLTTEEMDENFNYLNETKHSYAVAATGVVITFDAPKVYNTHTAPATGNITNNLTGAKMGVIQKIYHNHTIAPSMPAGWVLVGEGFYVPQTLNIISAEWVEGTRVEYWVTQ